MSPRRQTALIALSTALLAVPSASGVQVHTPAIKQVRAFGVTGGAPPVYVASASGLYRAASAPYITWTKRNSVGTIVAISPHPGASNSLVYYAGSTLYRSTDGGATATGVGSLAGITMLARSPAAPATVYAAGGTGAEADIYKSADDGMTWAMAYSSSDMSGFDASYILSLAVDSRNPAHLIAGQSVYHGGFLVESLDSGKTWHQLPAQSGTTLEAPVAVGINPLNSSDVWASWSVMGSGMLGHSRDGGHTWVAVTKGLPASFSVYAIAFDGLTGRVYVEVSIPNKTNRIYASRDGTSFEQFAPGATGIGTLLALVTTGGYLLSGDPSTPLRVRPLIGSKNWAVAAPFAAYYAAHSGGLLLGDTIGPSTHCGASLCQYFVKGRLEQHGAAIAYGALVRELQDKQVLLPVGGNPSTVTYKTLHGLAVPSKRVPPPPGFHGGTARVPGGTFIPYSPTLAVAPGHVVPPYFWHYMTQPSQAPGGWLHDIGLPLTEAISATVTKGALGQRTISLQAFGNVVLTYDPKNAPAYRVERANTGVDYATAWPRAVR